MTGLIDLTGQRFGRLIAIERTAPLSKSREAWWRCFCDCGNTKITTSRYLRTGISSSCGCLASELTTTRNRQTFTKHGEAAQITPEYMAWASMKSRCYNSKGKKYALYGGRGINICDRWRESFEAFLDDIGRRPSPNHSIDRYPNGDGNYEPGNVRWATYSEQNANRRTYTRRRKAS
jgi:hypothetical protein